MSSCNHNLSLLLALANIQAAVSSYLKRVETEVLLNVSRLIEPDDVHDLSRMQTPSPI